jgi:acetyl-CoA acetyltransferase
MAMSAREFRRRTAIAGVSATKQGLHPDRSAWELGIEAFQLALADAGLRKEEVDGLITQQMQDGSGQMESTRFGQMIGLNPKVSGSLDYGTAAFSIGYAATLVHAGICDVVACVYATNQRTGGYRFQGAVRDDGAPYGFLNPAGFAAMGYRRYLHEYGIDPLKLGELAVVSRFHAGLNPIAYKREPITLDDYARDRFIVWPLRRLDICLITDGAVCVIVTSAERARALRKPPVYMLGMGRQQALRQLENPGNLLLPHLRKTAAMVYEAAGVGPEEIDALYVQDAHSPVILQTLEQFGFCEPGEAADFIQGGRTRVDGALPINTNGGQLSEGYMVGWLHHVELVRQLRGECGSRQVPRCETIQFCATGGFREHSASIIYGR